MTCDFQQCGILTCVDSDVPVQPTFKLRNSKWCSGSSLTVLKYSSDKERLWSDCAYAKAGVSLCWSHIPHCWKSHVTAQILYLYVQTYYAPLFSNIKWHANRHLSQHIRFWRRLRRDCANVQSTLLAWMAHKSPFWASTWKCYSDEGSCETMQIYRLTGLRCSHEWHTKWPQHMRIWYCDEGSGKPVKMCTHQSSLLASRTHKRPVEPAH